MYFGSKLSALILSIFLSLNLSAKVVVISDIDDTIKKANSRGKFGKVWHFLKKRVFTEMRDVYVQLNSSYKANGHDVQFNYVSAAYDFTFKQEKWLRKNGFPKGSTRLRHIGDGNIENYKYLVVKRIVQRELQDTDEKVTFFFFGDNSDKDHSVYHQVATELKLDNAHIYVRDVATTYTYLVPYLEVSKLEGVNFFFSERDLVEDQVFSFLTDEWREDVITKFQSKELIPDYTLKTLRRRIKRNHCKTLLTGTHRKKCKKSSEEMSEKIWNEYHEKYPLRAFSESGVSPALLLSRPY